jgi:formamidopyrimidine-DNA glycosylase
MPELPEVESVRASLEPYLVGNKILNVQVNKPKLVSGNGTKRVASQEKKSEFENELEGEVFKAVKRRAKNLIFEFESGKILLVHLKMTGQMVYRDSADNVAFGGHPIKNSVGEDDLPNKHTHVVFELEEGDLYYNDTRMFGYLLYYPEFELMDKEGHFTGLGYEPTEVDFTLENFKEAIKERRGILKNLFLAQKVVVGLGNIYCDEVCFEAGVLPDRRVESLKDDELEALYEAIVRIIPAAIAAGGSSVANYVLGDGSRGTFVEEHKVYMKGGEPCYVCGEELQKEKIAGRTTVFCLNCQK